MVNRKKSSKKTDKVADDQVTPTAAEKRVPSDDTTKSETVEAVAEEVEAVPELQELNSVEDTNSDSAEASLKNEDLKETQTEAEIDSTEPEKSGPLTNPPVVVRKGGFTPLLLGGVAAAAIGYGAAYFGALPDQDKTGETTLKTEIDQRLQDLSGEIESLSARLGELSQGPDLSGVEAAQSDISAALASLTTRIETAELQFGTLDERLNFVEKRPIAEGASDAAVAAYERELKALQDAMTQQRTEIESMTADARQMEDNAEVTAQSTMRRAALTRIQTALDTGAGFAPALADLVATGVDAPELLTQIADEGAPSLALLQESFPTVARAALSASRKVAGDTGGGFSGFLKTQLGVRSLDPREGDDPDAVLSRVEAAIGERRLTDALAEIEALPEEGRAELSDWSGQVAQRLDAIAAVQALGENLN